MPYAITFKGRAFTPSGAAPELSTDADVSAHNAVVEAAELAHIATAPERIVAYVGRTLGDGMGVDRTGPTSRRALNLWAGKQIGTCFISSSWRVHSYCGTRMCQIYALVNGVAYTGRGFGSGMVVNLRRVKSRRKS